ncbi:MAG: ABC transporter permease [Desulfobacterota bacterium]|nr:ABC transporter permease [Thermodesulfobacteriota bacterium]
MERNTFYAFVKRLWRNKLAATGLCIVMLLCAIAAGAPIIAPYNCNAIDVKSILLPPSFQHICGTDELGRDVFSRMVYGSRISLAVGFVAVGISTILGTLIGAIAGYFGKWIDSFLMRCVDTMLCIPDIFLILTVIAFVGENVFNIMVVIGFTSWMGVARLVRAEFLTLKEREFVLAARAAGAGDARIIFIHILPNALGPVFVSAVLGVASAVLVESALSFLGLGVQPPDPSWGNILMQGKDNIETAWWLSVFPGCAILLTVLGYNMLGEGLQDILQPRLKNTR